MSHIRNQFHLSSSLLEYFDEMLPEICVHLILGSRLEIDMKGSDIYGCDSLLLIISAVCFSCTCVCRNSCKMLLDVVVKKLFIYIIPYKLVKCN